MEMTLDHIGPRMSGRHVDFMLIDTLWNQQDGSATEQQPVDRHAIRQACSTLSRLGERLTDLLTPIGAVGYRALPCVSSPTSVRFRPRRLWLEIRFLEWPKKSNPRPKIFVEFTSKQVKYGLSVCGFSSAQKSTEFWTTIHYEVPGVFESLLHNLDNQGGELDWKDTSSVAWSVARHRPPVEQTRFSIDINDCSRLQSKAISNYCDSFAIERKYEGPNLSIDCISAALADVVSLFMPLYMVNIGDDDPSHRSICLIA